MFIKGIGLISGAGVGLTPLQAVAQKQLNRNIEHSISNTQPRMNGNNNILLAEQIIPSIIPDELIKGYKLPRMMRRADRFSRICAIAANEAVTDAGSTPEIMKNSGIMIVSAIGPHQTTFAFLDELLDYPEAEVSPTKFSHSVHNAAASYISILCGINGMSLTITGFDNPWFNALVMAETVLLQGSCQQILLVGADEYGLLSTLLEDNLDKKLRGDFTECAAGMILSNQTGTDDYCSISTLDNSQADFTVNKNGIKLANGRDELINNNLPSTMFGNALDCVIAAISAKI